MNDRARPYLWLIVLAGCFTLVVFATNFVRTHSRENVLSAFADEVIETCREVPYPPSCYDTEIPKLMDHGLSMQETFSVVSLVTERTKNSAHSYFFCHVVAHNISAKETLEDPSAWASVLAQCPTGMCSNGCLHGAAQERFRNDVLTPTELEDALPELRRACPPASSDGFTVLEHAACYHALGHLAVYVTGASMPRALSMCDAVTKGEPIHFTRTCYEGAFMQVYQPLDAEDEALVREIAPKGVDDVTPFCAPYTGAAHSACTVESWPLYGIDRLLEPDALLSFCTQTPGDLWEKRCYADVFTIITTIKDFKWDEIRPVCERLPSEVQMQCFAHAAAYALITDYRLIPESVAFCREADEHGFGEHCYGELLFYSAYNFHQGSGAFNQLCAALPEPWGTKCAHGEGETLMNELIDSIP